MIKITFPDGKNKIFDQPVTIKEIAQDISLSLSKEALAGKVDDKLVPLSFLITENSHLEILTFASQEAWEIINYTGGIILANSLISLFQDTTLVQIGLNEEGFYLDFDCDTPLSENDLVNLEQQTLKMIKAKNFNNIIFSDGLSLTLKNYLYEHSAINQNQPGAVIIFNDKYLVADSFVATNFNNVKQFKLFSIAGVYLQNNANNKMIQRIHGTAHYSQELYEKFLQELTERRERDHRKIGKELEIFTFDKLVGPGLPIWLPNGMALKKVIQQYIREKEWEYDFIEVDTPVIGTSELYKISGHWDHYQENMFPPMIQDHEISVLRPMTCPHHIAVYNFKQRSYRDLPLRIAEHAILHRYESSGSLTGLERVRMMQLTDAHLFVRQDQIKTEFKRCFKLINEVLNTFKIKIDYYSLSLRDKNDKEKYYQDDEMWEAAEKMLAEALDELKIPYTTMVGEAAFYGPKLDVQIKTALNHEITVSTLQFDFLMPKKFDLAYIDQNNKKIRPVMIHRGLIGTFERFIATLLEQTKGNLPFWLAPQQIVLIPLANNNSEHLQYCEKLYQELKNNNYRVFVDDREERLNYKVRNAQIKKIPCQIVIGDQEIKNNEITYRWLGSEKPETINWNDFLQIINQKRKNRE